MLKHMLTHTGGHPKTGTNFRSPSIPTMEDLHGSPLPDPLLREARRNEARPVSVHGNVIHNQSIYANTVPLAKMANGGLNISASAPANNNSSRLNGSLNANLNLSNLNSSSNGSPGTTNQTRTTVMDSSREHSNHDLNTTQISPISRTRSNKTHQVNHNILSPGITNDIRRPHNSTFNTGLNLTSNRKLNGSLVPANVSKFMIMSKEVGVKEMITSLALLCLVSLLLALLSLVFLLKITPTSKSTNQQKLSDVDIDTSIVYEVTLAMCALSMSLNLCCLLVCAIQFLFAVKLVKTPQGKARTTKYLKEASLTRTCAIAGFFISIPVILTGIILYTFLHFDSTSAIVTAIFISIGIVFCGAAVVHNVFVWQKEKSKNMKPGQQMLQKNDILNRTNIKNSNFDFPQATIDLSGNEATYISAKGLELSTLV